ncbi:DUF6301 family protein [Nocardia sp. NPDC060249]|uniref:DUF6301 family protein n=1 Tax=Nocardia sp. NPDC060249 TaxID=3347082 RepID=UPI00365096A8
MAGEIRLGDVASYGLRIDGTLEALQNSWTVDHISYHRNSVESITEGFSNGMWIVGHSVDKLSEFVELFTVSPGSAPDLLVFSRMVDAARRQRHDLAAAARRSTNRRETERRVAAKVAVASEFDWTWTLDNFRRFCDIVGWHESYDSEDDGVLITDIDVQQSTVSSKVEEGEVKYCFFSAIDTVPARRSDGESTAGYVVEEFVSLAHAIESVIGPPNHPPGCIDGDNQITWILPKVIVRLRRSMHSFNVWMVNPEYIAHLD